MTSEDTGQDCDAPISSKQPIWVITICVIVALVASWLSVRYLGNRHYENRPELAMKLLPASADAESAFALQRVIAADGVVDQEGRRLLRSALRKAPLSAQPFVLAGLDASANNRATRARALFQEAERRDPRSMVAHYWLFDDYMQNGDFAQGLDEVEPTIALQSQTASGVMSYLSALLKIPAARSALIAKLRTSPGWRNAFFSTALKSPDSIEGVRQVMGAVRSRDPEEAARENAMLIDALFDAKQFADARAVWLASLPPVFRLQASGVYDGSFRSWPGSAPFNWRFPEARNGIVDLPKASDPLGTGLQVHFGGEAARVLAIQSLMPAPGRYTFVFTIAGAADQRQGGATIGVRAICNSNGKAIANETIDTIGQDAEQYRVPMVIADSCKAITMQFIAKPGISPGPLEASITNVALSPRG